MRPEPKHSRLAVLEGFRVWDCWPFLLKPGSERAASLGSQRTYNYNQFQPRNVHLDRMWYSGCRMIVMRYLNALIYGGTPEMI